MQRKNRFRTMGLLTAIACAFSLGGGSVCTAFPAEDEANNRRAFTIPTLQAFEGRELIVRVHPNISIDPEKYIKVRVPVRGGQLQLPAIKKTYPSVSRLTYLLCLAADQTDETTAVALEGFVYLIPYEDRPWKFQLGYPNVSGQPVNPYWTFLDARGNPMAGSSVEIRIVHPANQARLMGRMPVSILGDNSGVYPSSIQIGRATLDEKGRLKRILPNIGEFVFTLKHPRYGTAYVTAKSETVSQNIIRMSEGKYVLPLLPKDSSEEAQLIQGTVVETNGRPVKNAQIQIWPKQQGNPLNTFLAGSNPQPAVGKYIYGVFTEDNGQFSICEPYISGDLSVFRAAPAELEYSISIVPPKSLNLHQSNAGPVKIQTGRRLTYALNPMDGAAPLRTFKFKSSDGEITSPAELDKIELTLTRDGRQWVRLAYVDYVKGFNLPSGTLTADIRREDGSYNFILPEIEISAKSPKELIFQTPAQVVFRGRVIDAATGNTLAGVYVFFGNDWQDPNSWPVGKWQEYKDRAQSAKDSKPGSTLFGNSSGASKGGIYLTNAEGIYEIPINPGPYLIPNFSAAAPGYSLGLTQLSTTMRTSTGYPVLQPDANGIIQMPTIKMLRLDRNHHPRVVFEDENGRTIDERKLSSVVIKAQSESANRDLSLDMLNRSLISAVYSVKARLGDRYCDFEPVDLTKETPEIVVFKLRQARPSSVTYTGRVVNGTTGAPIWGAIVINNWLAMGMTGDASQIEPTQWDALKKIGSNPGSDDPVFLPFKNVSGEALCGFSTHKCAVTDQEGRFSFTTVNDSSGNLLIREKGSITVQPESTFIMVMANGYLSVQQLLGMNPAGSQFKMDPNGAMILPALRMPPAAKIRFHAIVPPDSGSNTSGILGMHLQWNLAAKDAKKWFPEMQPGRESNGGAAIVATPHWQVNADQTAYIPAGVKLTLSLIVPKPTIDMLIPNTSSSPKEPLVVMASAETGTLKLKQGEEKTLGRIRLKQPSTKPSIGARK